MTTLVSGGAVPAGSIMPFGGPIANIPDGFLACNGSLINRNDFPDLFAAIGTQWGTTTGVDFRVPTTNGNLLRGRAAGSGSDPESGSRTATQTGGAVGDNVGSLQTWRVQAHKHSTFMRNSGSTTWINGRSRGGFGNSSPITTNRVSFFAGSGGNGGPTQSSTSGSAYGINGNVNLNDTSPNSGSEFSLQSYYINTNNTGDGQTVGRNVYVEFIIKY